MIYALDYNHEVQEYCIVQIDDLNKYNVKFRHIDNANPLLSIPLLLSISEGFKVTDFDYNMENGKIYSDRFIIIFQSTDKNQFKTFLTNFNLVDSL